jgi:hypothetical protein
MPEWDAMEDIVDDLDEYEITEVSGKLFFFLWYIVKQ